MKNYKLIFFSIGLVVFVFLLLYGYIAIAGIIAPVLFELFSWVIPKSYPLYIIVDTVITALISGALFGVLFGYFFFKKTIIFAFLVIT